MRHPPHAIPLTDSQDKMARRHGPSQMISSTTVQQGSSKMRPGIIPSWEDSLNHLPSKVCCGSFKSTLCWLSSLTGLTSFDLTNLYFLSVSTHGDLSGLDCCATLPRHIPITFFGLNSTRLSSTRLLTGSPHCPETRCRFASALTSRSESPWCQLTLWQRDVRPQA